MTYCPRCGTSNNTQARFCNGCGQKLLNSASDAMQETIAPDNMIGKTCPYCQMPFKADSKIVLCPQCQMPHHRDCWIENGNKCTIFGCTSAGENNLQRTTEQRRNNTEPITVSVGVKNTAHIRFLIITIIMILVAVGGFMAMDTKNKMVTTNNTNVVADSEKTTIKIGFVAPLTGPSAQDGESMLRGARLAAYIANKKGGIGGRKIEIVAQDDKSDPREATTVANKFSADKSIMAVVGHFNSSCTLAGAPIYNKAGVVEISPGSSSPAVRGIGKFTFRTIATDAFQAAYLVKWAIKDEGFKKIAVVYENTDYGKGIATVVEQEIVKMGASVVAKEVYILGETKDYSAIVSRLKAAEPDVIIIGSLYNETALIAKQARRSGLNTPFMGVDAIYSDALIKLGGDAVNGIMLTSFFHSNSTNLEAQAFIKAYKELYKDEPGTYAAYSYDAAGMVIEALQKGKTDRAGIQAYLENIKDFKGVTGSTTFDAKHDCVKEPIKLIIKNGKFDIYKG